MGKFRLFLVLCAGWALHAAEPLLHQDFEAGESGWAALGPETARVHVTKDPSLVKQGGASLQFDYEASASHPPVALLRAPKPLGDAKAIRFWVRADSPTAEALVLTERGGARYVAVFWLDPQTWQKVELTPADFALGQNPGDPEDADGKLDMDQVAAISLLDVSQIFAQQFSQSAASLAIATHAGMQRILLDDFEISTSAPDWDKPRSALLIDDFRHPHLSWFTLGAADLKLDTTGEIIPGKVLCAVYEQLPDHFVVISRALVGVDLTGASELAFDIASDEPAQLVISLQETSPGKARGPHYTARLQIKGENQVTRPQIAFSSFELDENGEPDPSGKLDLAKVKSIGIVDISAAFTGETVLNTLRIGNVAAVKAPVKAAK